MFRALLFLMLKVRNFVWKWVDSM